MIEVMIYVSLSMANNAMLLDLPDGFAHVLWCQEVDLSDLQGYGLSGKRVYTDTKDTLLVPIQADIVLYLFTGIFAHLRKKHIHS